MTTSKGHLFQAKCWVKISQSESLDVCFLLRKLAKAKEKSLKRKKDNFGTFIYETKGKQEKMKIKGHRLHVRRKFKENDGK